MTVKEFLEKYDGAPYSEEEIAQYAEDVEGELGVVAKEYLEALERFNDSLDKIGFEFG